MGVGAAGGSSGGDSEDKNQQEAKQQQVKSTEPESAGEGKNSQEDEPELQFFWIFSMQMISNISFLSLTLIAETISKKRFL